MSALDGPSIERPRSPETQSKYHSQYTTGVILEYIAPINFTFYSQPIMQGMPFNCLRSEKVEVSFFLLEMIDMILYVWNTTGWTKNDRAMSERNNWQTLYSNLNVFVRAKFSMSEDFLTHKYCVCPNLSLFNPLFFILFIITGTLVVYTHHTWHILRLCAMCDVKVIINLKPPKSLNGS